jgi:putative ABC transport system permease protein
MFKNYIKIAWRNLWNNKFYSLLNILGLAVATALFLLIINFVRFEYSYENFHKKADNIYRITLDLYDGSEYVITDAETYPPLAPLLKSEWPEVKEYVRMQLMENIPEMRYENQVYHIDKIYAADPSIFTVFNHTFIQGDPTEALNAPMQAVVTESLAKRLFGSVEDAREKVLRYGEFLFTVTGVIKDSPPNTHLKVNMLISFSSLERAGYNLDSWNGNNNYTYVQLQPDTDLKFFNDKLAGLSKERLNDEVLVAESINDIHLYSNKTFEPEVNGDSKTVRFLFVIAILILLIGSINYMNLTTARSAERIKEVGMRKVLGSSRQRLIAQFLTETLLINLIAMALALQLVQLALPYYFQLIGRPIEADFFSVPLFWAACAGLFLFNCLLSGLYPALSLSRVEPISVTRRLFTGSGQSELFRKALVVGQFTAAMVVLSASFIVFKQISFMQNQDLGVNTSEVLVVRAPSEGADSLLQRQNRVYKNTLSQLPGVENVSISEGLPGLSLHQISTTSGIRQYGSDEDSGYNYYIYAIDEEFISNMEIELVAGRNFRAGSANLNEFIISEEAARLIGFESPEAAIGEKITISTTPDTDYSTVIGVFKDYHQQSLKRAILPMMHWYSDGGSYFSAKLKTKDIRASVDGVKRIWETQFPGYPFEYYFLDEMFDQQYKADRRFGQIVAVFSGFTLFITCLGLLGLTAYTVRRRTKEIGVRKILGASVADMVALLSKDFMKLVLIAVLIATPIAWYVMSRWLQSFAYRIELQWWIFALAGLLAVLVALATVSLQSVKAAMMNPVDSLRSE